MFRRKVYGRDIYVPGGTLFGYAGGLEIFLVVGIKEVVFDRVFDYYG
jgi:hypothetical protein